MLHLKLFAAVLLFASPILSLPAKHHDHHRRHLTKLITFGDSYVDNGNRHHSARAVTNGTWPLSVYYHGGFSNGPMWNTRLAKTLSVRLYSFAYGGATASSAILQGATGPNSDVPVPGVVEQIALAVEEKLDWNDGVAVVWIQGNDFFFDPSTTGGSVADTILKKAVPALVKAGARKVLLLTMHDITKLPFFRSGETFLTNETAKAGFTSYNNGLWNGVGDLRKEFPHLKIKVVDVSKVFGKMEEKPSTFGLSDVVDACLVIDGITVQSECAKPRSYMWWDQFHQTAGVDKEIAKLVKRYV